ncbi:hypothetical protein ADEAN_000203600 [Angomonas deanei]|uniref:Transmembrane protein n=1 Tax=Angomonas deanei TaxID=59799 RepID=A0A7G2C517_9TRYP|nr:hypothetical protein ADEAN_000203600 [Angomonas deanei]
MYHTVLLRRGLLRYPKHTSSLPLLSARWQSTTPVDTTTTKKTPIDLGRLPDTIPGVSREELAAMIERHHKEAEKEARAASAQAAKLLTEEVELMRRSMSPEDFEKYIQRIHQVNDANLKEELKMAAMSPEQLHLYMMKKKREAAREGWKKMVMLVCVFIGTLISLFASFFMFYNG